MIYLVTALDAEARPLIEHFCLRRESLLPFPLYRNDDTVLIVTQMGMTNALMAVSALLGCFTPKEGDILINVGICAAPENHSIGTPLLIHRIDRHDRHYYPDILFDHPLIEESIVCVDASQDVLQEHPADMESAGVFMAATKFMKLHSVAFLKIVSDHFDPDAVTKELAIALIRNALPDLEALIEKLKAINTPNPLFTSEECEQIGYLKSLFTKSQGEILEDACLYRRLASPEAPLELEIGTPPASKRERSELHGRLITKLRG